VSSGSSISEVNRRYGIKGGATVQSWIKKFGREDLLNKVVRIEMKGEKDRLKTVRRLNLLLRCYEKYNYLCRIKNG
jgi:transposase-like protein